MKRSNYLSAVMIAVMAIVMVGVSPKKVNAQENQTLWALVDYMKVNPGNGSMYLDVEQKIWKPIHQARVDNGNIMGWVLYRVWYTGSDAEYNYVTVTLFNNPSNLENPYEGIEFEKVHPGKDMDQAMEKTGQSRDMVKSDLINMAAYAYKDGELRPSPYKYVQINFMKAYPGENFLQVRRRNVMPIQQELVNAGTRAGWSLWRAVYPRGFGRDYQFATADYFADFSQIGAGNYLEAMEKAHPGRDAADIGKENRKAGIIMKTELWEVVDAAMKQP